MMKKIVKKQDGAIALTTLLIVFSILLFSGTTLILLATDFSKSLSAVNNGSIAQIHAQSCMEESLIRLKENIYYSGSITINIDNGYCQADVSIDQTNNNYRDIEVSSYKFDSSYYQSSIVDISGDEFVIIE